ncbi:MAG TPA: hypothetical protein VGX78_10995, partial [Pirellulales bacterium]|nr:hypothetical protein [Pirellulales bacterium]
MRIILNRLQRELNAVAAMRPGQLTKSEPVMHTSEIDFEPDSYQDAVDALARSEHVAPAIVEELLQPELSEWVRAFHRRPLRFPELREALKGRLQNRVEKEGIAPS